LPTSEFPTEIPRSQKSQLSITQQRCSTLKKILTDTKIVNGIIN